VSDDFVQEYKRIRREGGSILCPHCRGVYILGDSPNRLCLDCYWQEGDDPEHPVSLSADGSQ
jgi:hypothetical protein